MKWNPSSAPQGTWIDKELEACAFPDPRLGKRFRALVGNLAERIGESIPLACQDWAGTKAAYRFFSNRRVSEAKILSGHFQATRERVQASSGPVLVLHDTTEFSFKRESKHAIGVTNRNYTGLGKDGRPRFHTLCGMLMHSSLVLTLEGLPLGLSAVKFWTRKKFKGCNAQKKKINPTRVPIEEKESMRWIENLRQSTELLNQPDRCIHVGDRESDIYELFCAAKDAGTHFLVRICADRLAGNGSHTIEEEMRRTPVRKRHRIEIRDAKGKPTEVLLEIRYCRMRVLAPVAKQKHYPDTELTVIHALEKETPTGRARIDWKLATDLPVNSPEEAIEKLQWYALRWNIETFHKILKSGCRAEDSRLRSAERLARLIAVFCILSWRIFWMTKINRSAPAAPAAVAFTTLECQLLDHLVQGPSSQQSQKSLSSYIAKLARLGGYLARANDPPPGNMVMWRGLSRLTDIELGFQLGQTCG